MSEALENSIYLYDISNEIKRSCCSSHCKNTNRLNVANTHRKVFSCLHGRNKIRSVIPGNPKLYRARRSGYDYNSRCPRRICGNVEALSYSRTKRVRKG
ncbi:hypothetical protein D3C76_1504240 [compost metagenome]